MSQYVGVRVKRQDARTGWVGYLSHLASLHKGSDKLITPHQLQNDRRIEEGRAVYGINWRVQAVLA